MARRLNLLFENGSLKVWDDFAHHPTAIANTLDALTHEEAPLIAVIELRSNTMKAGVHREALVASAACADFIYWVLPETTTWDTSLLSRSDGTSVVVRDVFSARPQLVQRGVWSNYFYVEWRIFWDSKPSGSAVDRVLKKLEITANLPKYDYRITST